MPKNVTVQYETLPTADGNTTIRVAGRFLHSSYRPGIEAERVLDRFVPERSDGVVIVIGEGVPYFSSRLAERYPSMKVIAVTFQHVQGDFSGRIHRIPIAVPDVLDIRGRIRNALTLLDVSRVQAFLWPPALQCITDWSESVQQGVVQGVQDGQSELYTVASFGMTWLRNALGRAIRLEERLVPGTHAGATLVCAGGPSVAQPLPRDFLKTVEPVVIAASSAADALLHAGVSPDILVHLDAGFWAKRYRRRIPTVVSLRSSGGTGRGPFPEICVRSGWIGDILAIDGSEWPHIGEAPTVTGSTLAYSDSLLPEGSALYLIGIDLCTYDLIIHGRPHPNDRFIDARTNRLRPDTTLRAERSGMVGDIPPLSWPDGTRAFRTPSLAAFLQPVATRIESIRRRRSVYNLSSAPTWRESGVPRYDAAGTTPRPAALKRGSVTFTPIERPSLSERRRHTMSVLNDWHDMLETGTPTDSVTSLLLHLAPVETIAASRDRGELRHALAAGKMKLVSMMRWVER